MTDPSITEMDRPKVLQCQLFLLCNIDTQKVTVPKLSPPRSVKKYRILKGGLTSRSNTWPDGRNGKLNLGLVKRTSIFPCTKHLLLSKVLLLALQTVSYLRPRWRLSPRPVQPPLWIFNLTFSQRLFQVLCPMTLQQWWISGHGLLLTS